MTGAQITHNWYLAMVKLMLVTQFFSVSFSLAGNVPVVPTRVDIGACVPPYIYVEQPNDAQANDSVVRVPFFTVDCNGNNMYWIGLNGKQIKLKANDPRQSEHGGDPSGTYTGDNLIVELKRGAMLSETMGGAEVLNASYQVQLSVKRGASVDVIQGVYRIGP